MKIQPQMALPADGPAAAGGLRGDGGDDSDSDPASQLLHHGFVHFPSIYPPSLVEELRIAIDVKLEPQLEDAYGTTPFQGSSHQLEKVYDPAIVKLLSEPAAIDAMARCGITAPKYRDGYILSKPPGGHALYWHRDWGCWNRGGPADEETVSPVATQMFLMLYLVDTAPFNGCLRVLPGSHLRRIALDDESTTAGIPSLERLEGTHGGTTLNPWPLQASLPNFYLPPPPGNKCAHFSTYL